MTSLPTELDMHEAEVPTFETPEEVLEYVRQLVAREHDYGTCAHAMSMAATAAFNYVASALGVTGAQASYASLDILRRTRGIDGPFMVVLARDQLYPQYAGVFDEAVTRWSPWLREQARELLKNTRGADYRVVAHWRRLAEEDVS